MNTGRKRWYVKGDRLYTKTQQSIEFKSVENEEVRKSEVGESHAALGQNGGK